MTLITDPWFYVTAIPAVLIIGISKAGFGSAFGSLAVPLMALTVTVPQAAALLLPSLFVMDALGLKVYWKQADWKLLRVIMPAGLVGIVIGWYFFSTIDPKYAGALVGATAIGFILLRSWQSRRAKHLGGLPPYTAPIWIGRVCAIASGFTSFVAHAGGPPLAIYTLPQKLNPVTFTASMTVFFAIINLCKWVPYASLGMFSMQHAATAGVLMLFAPIGNVIGIRIAKTININVFYRVVNTALLLSGCKLMYDALR